MPHKKRNSIGRKTDDAKKMCLSRFSETNEHRNIRLSQQQERTLQLRDNESVEERQARLAVKQTRSETVRQNESAEERQAIEKDIQILGAMKV
jgi:hypothetical protein